jgi:tetratricopeptide (TPR) repeat protein
MKQAPFSDEAPGSTRKASETVTLLPGKVLRIVPSVFIGFVLLWIYATGMIPLWLGLFESKKYEQQAQVQAIKYFTWAIAANPRLAKAYEQRAAAKFELEKNKGTKADYTDALKDVTKAIQLEPRAEYYQTRQSINRAAKKYRDELADVEHLIGETTWQNYPQLDNRAYIHELLNEPGLALADREAIIVNATREISKNKEKPWSYDYQQRAEQYKFVGQIDKAIADYKSAIKLHPDSNDELALGHLLENSGRESQAIATYTKLIESFKDSNDNSGFDASDVDQARWRRANFYLKHGQYANALADADEMIKYSDSDLRHAFRIKILRLMGQQDRAKSEIQSTLGSFNEYANDTAENKADRYSARANCYAELGEFKNAMRDYSTAFSLDPKPMRSSDCAQTYCKLADYNNAIKYYNKTITDSTDESELQTAADGLAEVHLLLNKPELSVQDCYKAIGFNNTDPRSGAPYYWRALAYKKLGQSALAKFDQDQAIALNFSPEPELE